MPKGVHETESKQSGQKQQRTSLEGEQQIFHRKKETIELGESNKVR
jgi:hypothetical protein